MGKTKINAPRTDRMPNAFCVAAMRTTDCIVSLAAKAKKVGGLFLALNGAAVRPTDAVDAKKEYDLLVMDGSTPVTPVEPEVTPVVEE